MATFITAEAINLKLHEMITNADSYLWFISPYIKLHDRIKDELKKKREKHDLEIVFLFGKNDEDPTKSLSKEDIEFLKEFPNIKICYEKNLHAKFYANQDGCLITSMNLHLFSQNTNIEVGIFMQAKSIAKELASMALQSEDMDDKANSYFEGVIKASKVIFERKPQYEKGLLGLTKKYTGSINTTDNINEFFGLIKSDYKTPRPNSFNQFNSSFQPKQQEPQSGFCIRTGVPIPFNPTRPFSYEAFQTWAQFENWDFPEKFCHLTGRPSYGKTSMRNPIM